MSESSSTRARRTGRIWGAAGLVVAGFLAWALWPRPIEVDVVAVERGGVRVEVVDEGRTRMHDVYVVSAPVAGRVLRVDVLPGDAVARGAVVARLTQSAAGFLDARGDAQARAAVEAAAAALRAAEAQAVLAEREYERARALRERNLVAEAVVDQARARLDADVAALGAARAELARARAALLAPERAAARAVEVRSPVDGYVLRVPQRSEAVVPSGAPLVEIGDPARLEVVAEFLSQDAVRMRPGAPAVVEGWGGPPLAARVQRVEPVARTKISALGVEEQRTNVILDFEDPAAAARLGHDFRVDARVVVEEFTDVLRVPLGALFRVDGEWSVFRVSDGRAVRTPVRAGASDGTWRAVESGLESGEPVILFPGSLVADGTRVVARGR